MLINFRNFNKVPDVRHLSKFTEISWERVCFVQAILQWITLVFNRKTHSQESTKTASLATSGWHRFAVHFFRYFHMSPFQICQPLTTNNNKAAKSLSSTQTCCESSLCTGAQRGTRTAHYAFTQICDTQVEQPDGTGTIRATPPPGQSTCSCKYTCPSTCGKTKRRAALQ